MRDSRFLAMALALCLVVVGCGESVEQTAPPADPPAEAPGPAAAVKAMLALAEAGAWGDYVDRYYGEQAKFGSPADRDALVKRFDGAWGPKVLEALRRAAPLTPTVEGDQAVFADEDGPVFVLHRAADGAWTFHL